MKKYILVLLILFVPQRVGAALSESMAHLPSLGTRKLVIFNDSTENLSLNLQESRAFQRDSKITFQLARALQYPDQIIIASGNLWNNLKLGHQMWEDFSTGSIHDKKVLRYAKIGHRWGDAQRTFKLLFAYTALFSATRALIEHFQIELKDSGKTVSDFLESEGKKYLATDFIADAFADEGLRRKLSATVHQDFKEYYALKKESSAAAKSLLPLQENSILELLLDPGIHFEMREFFLMWIFYTVLKEEHLKAWNCYCKNDIPGVYIFIPKNWSEVNKALVQQSLSDAQKLAQNYILPVAFETGTRPATVFDVWNGIKDPVLNRDKISRPLCMPINLEEDVFIRGQNFYGKILAKEKSSDNLLQVLIFLLTSSYAVKLAYKDYLGLVLPEWDIVLDGHGDAASITSGFTEEEFRFLLGFLKDFIRTKSLSYISCFPAGTKLISLFHEPYRLEYAKELGFSKFSFPILALGNAMAEVTGGALVMDVPPFVRPGLIPYLVQTDVVGNKYLTGGFVGIGKYNDFFKYLQNRDYSNAANTLIQFYNPEAPVMGTRSLINNYALIKPAYGEEFVPVLLPEGAKGAQKMKVLSNAMVRKHMIDKAPLSIKGDKVASVHLQANDISCPVSFIDDFVHSVPVVFVPLSTRSYAYHFASIDAHTTTFLRVLKSFMGIQGQKGEYYFIIDTLRCLEEQDSPIAPGKAFAEEIYDKVLPNGKKAHEIILDNVIIYINNVNNSLYDLLKISYNGAAARHEGGGGGAAGGAGAAAEAARSISHSGYIFSLAAEKSATLPVYTEQWELSSALQKNILLPQEFIIAPEALIGVRERLLARVLPTFEDDLGDLKAHLEDRYTQASSPSSRSDTPPDSAITSPLLGSPSPERRGVRSEAAADTVFSGSGSPAVLMSPPSTFSPEPEEKS